MAELPTALPDTAMLLRLRRAFDAELLPDASLPAMPDAVFHVFHEQRHCVQDLLEAMPVARDRPAELLAAFQAVWTACSTLPLRHVLYVPPIYEESLTTGTLRDAMRELLLRELRLKTGSSDNISHIVFGGLEGTGKTTILKALAIASAVCLHNMLPVTWNYECDAGLLSTSGHVTTPLEHMARVATLLRAAVLPASFQATTPSDDACFAHGNIVGAVDLLEELGVSPVFFLDEFQLLFHKSVTAAERAIPACRQLAAVCRLGNVYAFVSGSAANMRAYMFRGVGTVEDCWRASGYPDFNGTLFTFRHVAPLRTPAALRAFMSKRYPMWEMSEDDAELLLTHTGGIGRLVHAVWERTLERALCTDDSTRPIADCLPSLTGLPAAGELASLSQSTRSRTAVNSVAGQAGMLTLVQAIISANSDAINAARSASRRVHLAGGAGAVAVAQTLPRLPCLGIAEPHALAALYACSRDGEDARAKLDTLLDGGLLYRSVEHGTIELAVPADALALRDIPSLCDSLLWCAVQLMVSGVTVGEAADESCEVENVNSGTALEAVVRGGVGRLLPGAAASGGYAWRNTRVRIEHSRLEFERAGMTDFTPVTSVAGIAGELLTWKSETGLDGVVFTRVTDASPWLLHGWQCQGGRTNVEVTGGRLSTSLKIWDRTKGVGDLDDSTIHGIVVKAMVGMCKLLEALPAPTPAERVLLGSITLTTTKNADKAVASVVDWGGHVRLDRSVLEHCAPALARRGYKGQLLGADVAVHVEHGLRWVHDCALPGLVESLGPLVGRYARPSRGDAMVAASSHRSQPCAIM